MKNTQLVTFDCPSKDLDNFDRKWQQLGYDSRAATLRKLIREFNKNGKGVEEASK